MPNSRTQQTRGRSTPSGNRSSRGGRGGRSTRTTSRSRQSRAGSTRSASSRRESPQRLAFTPNEANIEELVLQALETELGGVQVYETAIRCAQNEDLKEEWQEYLDQTRNHVEVVQEVCQKLGLDPNKETPGREIVRLCGQTFVQAMEKALESGDLEKAECVAAEMVVHAEVKDHGNWELIGLLAEELDGERAQAFQEAYDEVEEEEDEHLYHTMGWARELWIQGLGLPAALPPPEEEKDAKSMAQAAKAKAQRKRSVKASR